MRRLIALLPCAVQLLASACSWRDASVRFDDMATMLNMADPRAPKQLVKGFFPVEGGGRWTTRTFSATLKPPPTAARKGAVLVLRFGIPGPSMERLHSIQIAATVNGVELAAGEYTKAGEYSYIRNVPAAAFRGDAATVDFTLDKALPPDGTERRELGVVAITVGFEAN